MDNKKDFLKGDVYYYYYNENLCRDEIGETEDNHRIYISTDDDDHMDFYDVVEIWEYYYLGNVYKTTVADMYKKLQELPVYQDSLRMLSIELEHFNY